MKLVLKSYSQDVAITDASKTKFMLAFEDEESGHEIRLSVSQETITELVHKIVLLDGAQSDPAPQENPEVDLSGVLNEEAEGAEVFGEELEEEEDETPASEDEVPSL